MLTQYKSSPAGQQESPLTLTILEASEYGVPASAGLALADSAGNKWETILGDGSLPGPPNQVALAGPNLFLAGPAYVGVVDIKARRIRSLCYLATEGVEGLQIGGGFLWTQFEHNLYRVPLTTLE